MLSQLPKFKRTSIANSSILALQQLIELKPQLSRGENLTNELKNINPSIEDLLKVLNTINRW